MHIEQYPEMGVVIEGQRRDALGDRYLDFPLFWRLNCGA
jgi:regulator of RNase E activity RraA